MVAVKLKHTDLAQHQACIFKQLHMFRNEGQLCDVVVKSCDGTEHKAHTAVLCAASVDLKNMLLGRFHEANQVQQGQPVEMAASDSVIAALLEYIYGEEPQVELEDSLELLRVGDAYNFPHLASAIEAGLLASLDTAPLATALKLLQQAQNLHDLKAACEERVAGNFELCIEMAEFLALSAGQLGRILRRDDLNVSREEIVLQGLWNWQKKTKDRGICFGSLLLNVDLQSLSSGSLAQLGCLSASMGQVGHDLETEVGEALRARKRRSLTSTPDSFRPKRRCLHHWSPDLGATPHGPNKVLPIVASMCCHDGAIYCIEYANPSSILRWKPGDLKETIAGRGARVTGVNDLGSKCEVALSPEGIIFVADKDNRRLVRFQNGSGNVVLSDVDIGRGSVFRVFCSPNGTLYVLTQRGTTVEKLVGAKLHPLICSSDLPAALQFQAFDFFVTKDEAVYLSDEANGRVLRINPHEAEPVVVGEAPNKESCKLCGLFVTEDEKIYVADYGQQKVWTFYPGDATWTEVLTCTNREMFPRDVLVHGQSLYVNLGGPGVSTGVYEYLLPPELQLR